MRFHRKERIGKLILEELNNVISRELEFKEALVTLTDVKVSDDLEVAAVRFSVIPSEKSGEVLKILEKFTGRFQHRLLKKINIKPLPRIRFEIDHGIENAAEIEKLLIKEHNSD